VNDGKAICQIELQETAELNQLRNSRLQQSNEPHRAQPIVELSDIAEQ